MSHRDCSLVNPVHFKIPMDCQWFVVKRLLCMPVIMDFRAGVMGN